MDNPDSISLRWKYVKPVFGAIDGSSFVFQVNVSELGMVTQGGKVVWGEFQLPCICLWILVFAKGSGCEITIIFSVQSFYRGKPQFVAEISEWAGLNEICHMESSF